MEMVRPEARAHLLHDGIGQYLGTSRRDQRRADLGAIHASISARILEQNIAILLLEELSDTRRAIPEEARPRIPAGPVPWSS
jgi:hypothetical protein